MKKILIALLIIVAFAQCADEQTSECSVPATLRDLTGLDGCGWVFELSDGTRLEPVINFYCGTPPLSAEITDDPLYNYEFVDGKNVFISYRVVDDIATACMAGTLVKITCLSERVQHFND